MSARNRELYRTTVQQAAGSASELMDKLISHAQQELVSGEAALSDAQERTRLDEAARQLGHQRNALCAAYPKALLIAFANPEGSLKSATTTEVQFDQLELMDTSQVQVSLAMARVQQHVLYAAETSLGELNALVCSLLGLSSVRPGRNPLRPDTYVSALKNVLEQTRVPEAMQIDWLTAMVPTLGAELSALYTRLCAMLRKEGVRSASYTAVVAPAEQTRSAAKSEELLTLDRLRQLVSGDLDAAQPSHFGAFAGDGGEEASQPTTDFDSTVPAALEALTEMKQVERVVERLEKRRAGGSQPLAHGPGSIEAERAALRSTVRNLAQTLSLEVVTLMVENIAQDGRLLVPVQQLVRGMEAPLLRLSLAEPRFFHDKRHPARQLLQEVTHHSMAFPDEKAYGFSAFMREMQDILEPLRTGEQAGVAAFDAALAQLQASWKRLAARKEQEHTRAVDVLRHAEARNLLAERISKEIYGHRDVKALPEVVLEFLCGPWAQVVAQARITSGVGSETVEKYQALIPTLVWSCMPEMTRNNLPRLARRVPRILSTLREGLESIRFPADQTDQFFASLMEIHQQAFREHAEQAQSSAPASDAPGPQDVSRVGDGDPWIAPEEAQSSNFVQLADPLGEPLPDPLSGKQSAGPAADPSQDLIPDLVAGNGQELSLGTWVEILRDGQWVRTQLTWASPHGTFYLFTSAFGNTQSMTRHSLDKMIERGRLNVLSGQPVVDGALDAVAQTAMRNSLDAAG
jgi:Protein of unknown function (DUF1631)